MSSAVVFLQVIQTFQVAAELGSQSLGAYVISMAKKASDVLAVELLQREALLTVGGTRFVSSKSSTTNTVSPTTAAANAAATVNGQLVSPFAVPSTVHTAKPINLTANADNGDGASGPGSSTGQLHKPLLLC